MSSSNAFLRALSPSFGVDNAPTFLVRPGEDAFGNNEYVTASPAPRRHAALQAANSVGEVIGFIPHDFRHVLAGPLRAIAATADRLNGVQATLAKWCSHQAAGTFPPFMSQKVPEVQFTKGFEESAECKSSKDKLTNGHKDYLKGVLSNFIRAKTDEEGFLKRALSHDSIFAQLSPLVITRTGELARASKLPVVAIKEGGECEVTSWEENTGIQSIGKMVLEDLVVYAYRIISIVEASVAAASRKKEAKKAVHAQADIEMQDGTAGPSIQSLVDKGINAALKRIGATVSDSDLPDHFHSTDPYSTGRARRRTETGSGRCSEGPSQGAEAKASRGKSTSTIKSPWSTRRGDTRRRPERKGKGEGRLSSNPVRPTPSQTAAPESAGWYPLGDSQSWKGGSNEAWAIVSSGPKFDSTHVQSRTRGGVLKHSPIDNFDYYVHSIDGSKFVYGNPESIPDEVIELPLPQAVSWVILNPPESFIAAAKFRKHVHRGPGVSIPENLEHNLSVGMKYLFHQPRRTELIQSA